MPKIHVLDKHTAELIAAGEVVERPASVAKELLENAIDAGASQITLSIRRGGIEQLQISDNGCGIEAESVENAFVRHATSKIAAAEDLAHIHTLGFRGEALASIASVARVELLTKTDEDEFACLYRIEGGEGGKIEPGARGRGTTITVNDLFYNTPARMKFLKKDASEGSYVGEAVLHVALSHPEISFRFVKDGKQQFVTPGDGDLRSAAYAVLGREFARDLLTVEGEGRRLQGVRPYHSAARLPRFAQRAAFLRQWPLCQKPHDDGRARKRLQGHRHAGQVPGRNSVFDDAGRACRCQCPPGKNRDPVCAGERCVRRGLPCRAVCLGHAGQRRMPVRARPYRTCAEPPPPRRPSRPAARRRKNRGFQHCRRQNTVRCTS